MLQVELGDHGGIYTFTPGALNFGLLILTLTFFKFFKEAEQILKEMFQFDKEVSLANGTGFAKMILYDQTFKRLEKIGKKKKDDDSEQGEKPIYIKAKEMFENRKSKKTSSTSASTTYASTVAGPGTGSTNSKANSSTPVSEGEAKAKNKFLSAVGQTAGKVLNTKAGKAVKNTYVFAGKNVAPSIVGGLMGFAVADKNPMDEIIAGGIAGHVVANKAIVPKAAQIKKNFDLHNDYADNAKKTSQNVEEQLHNIEKITGQNFDNTTVEGKQNIENFLQQVKSKMNNGKIMQDLSTALDKYKEHLMKFEGKTKLEADLLVTKKLNELKENKVDYTNIDGAERDLAVAYNQTKIASEISEFNATNATIGGNFEDAETVLLSGKVAASGGAGQMGPMTQKEEYRNFKNEINEVMEEMRSYTEKNEKLKEEIEMMKRTGLSKDEVMQKYKKTQKRTQLFKTKVEKRKLRTDLTNEERDEYDKLITRIEARELKEINQPDYEKLVLDTYK